MYVADIGTHYTKFPAFTAADGNEGTIRDILAEIKKYNVPLAAIDSVEGPNETDHFWAMFQKSYKGQGWRTKAGSETDDT